MRTRLSGGGLLSILTVAFVGVTPTVAAARETVHTINGAGTDTATLNVLTGQGTTLSAGHLSHLGDFTGVADAQFIPDPNDPSKFSFSGSSTLTATNGDKLFTTFKGSGVNTSPTASEKSRPFAGNSGRRCGRASSAPSSR